MKNKNVKIVFAIVLALVLTIPAITVSIFAANPTYVYAINFDGMPALKKGENGLSSAQDVPALSTLVKDPVKNGNKGDVVKMVMSVVNPDNANLAAEEASTGRINGSSAGTNVDRNLTVANPEFSYTKNPKLVFEVDYFLEEGSSGTFESQMIGYKSNGTAGSWLNLWRVNVGTGVVYVLNSGSYSVTIPVGEWVTLSLVVDMVTGNTEFYVNNVYRISAPWGKTNLSFDENKWNIAKINKQNNASMINGAFYVDNARVHTYAEATDYQTIQNESGEIILYMDVTSTTGNTSLYEAGVDGIGKILKTPAGKSGSIEYAEVALKPKTLDSSLTEGLIAPADTPSIRIYNAGGIRFGTNLSTKKLAELQELQEDGFVKYINIGTLIAPKSYVKEAGEFSIAALSQLSYDETYIDVKATLGKYYEGSARVLKQGYDQWFTGSITNVLLDNRERDFAAIGYVKITLSNGSVIYRYSYNNKDMTLVEKYAANIASVANTALKASGWTEKQQLMLKDLAANATSLTLSSNVVKNVQTKRSQIFFTLTQGTDKTTDDVYCRLTYDGANGWRLQANPTDYNHFEDVGAGQALSIYMGEGFQDVMIPLTIKDENGKLKITADNSATYAVLDYKTFGIDFYSGAGKQTYNVNSVTKLGSKMVMTGALDASEGIYGGGERFDASNRRGTSMNLFTYDAYDAGGTTRTGTYVAIPLFSTSRGGGMFINRYEPMIANFDPAGAAGNWRISLDNELIDTYFYSTGKMSDVLKAYTDMTGHAALPEEWAQGNLICRYSPDYGSLEGISGNADGVIWFYQLTEIPSYNTYYTDSAAKNKVTATSTFKNGTFLYNSSGTRMYRYVVEGAEDVNYNGRTGETYFIRVCKKSGPSGAGVIYIIESLIDAGMMPTAVVLEGHGWDQISTNATQYESLKSIADYLDELDIKLTVYMGIASISGHMKGYKSEYQVWASIYEYDSVTGTKGELIDRTYKIPKTDYSDNPDTVASGGTQQYLDITNPEAVDWYMNIVWDQMIDLGIDGAKIDFCETMPNEGYYKGMTVNSKVVDGYIEYDWHNEKIFEGDTVHHAYSSYFISLFYKTMMEQKAAKNIDDGFVVLSRGGGIGSQRNPYMWAGDQSRRFLNLSTQLAAVINSGISGIPFMTYDMAGYAYKNLPDGYFGNYTVAEYDGNLFIPDLKAAELYESEIFIRSMQYTIFGNTVQTHGDVRHLYHLTSEAQEITEMYDALHTELMWYSQKTSQYACDTGMPMIRHMVLQYQNDANVINIDDQFMYGDALLVAPILTYNAKTENGKRVLDYGSDATRTVYLPAGTWIDLNSGKTIVSKGETIEVTVGLAQIPVFLNTASEDAAELQKVFDSAVWRDIKRYQY